MSPISDQAVNIIEPRAVFYKIYSQKHIIDIIESLENYQEIPNQYTYFDIGAEYWDQYVQRLAHENTPNSFKSLDNLLKMNINYLDYLCTTAKVVNVIDIGVGNAMPIKDIIVWLKNKGIFGKYIGIDLSPKMLEIAHKNLVQWFGSNFPFEERVLDMNHETFVDTLAYEYFNDATEVINLVFLLGGTINNMRNPETVLRSIHDSIGKKDILIHTLKLDSKDSQKYFDFNLGADEEGLTLQDRFILDLLNINPAFYETTMNYEPELRQRTIRIKLAKALRISFKIGKKERIVSYKAGDSILIWRFWHQNGREVLEQFNQAEFYPLHASFTQNMQYILTISKIKY